MQAARGTESSLASLLQTWQAEGRRKEQYTDEVVMQAAMIELRTPTIRSYDAVMRTLKTLQEGGAVTPNVDRVYQRCMRRVVDAKQTMLAVKLDAIKTADSRIRKSQYLATLQWYRDWQKRVPNFKLTGSDRRELLAAAEPDALLPSAAAPQQRSGALRAATSVAVAPRPRMFNWAQEQYEKDERRRQKERHRRLEAQSKSLKRESGSESASEPDRFSRPGPYELQPWNYQSWKG